MGLYNILNKSNNALFDIYNLTVYIRYIINYTKIHQVVGVNKKFKLLHDGEECFIVLNGESILNNDLKLLEGKDVFCVNNMYGSNLADCIHPLYYCWIDSALFSNKELAERTVDSIQKKFPYTDLFLNYKAFNVVKHNEHIYYTYNKYMPTTNKFRFSLDGITSGFTNVLGYVISIAIYMGYRNINILGLDFDLRFKHFYDQSEEEKKDVIYTQDDSLTMYGSLLKAHSEFIGIEKYAKRHNILIKNLNKDSFVREFEFSTLNEIIEKG